MGVVDFIKEKNAQFQKNQNDLRNMIEPQLRDFSDTVLKKIDSTKNSPWFVKLSQIYEGNDFEREAIYPPVRELCDKLDSLIGKEIGLGEWFTLDQDRINRFADVTEDRQWIHVDRERAKKESPFRSTVSHGFLTLSLLPKLTGSVNPISDLHENARMVVNHGLNRVRFPYPAKPGTQIRARTTLKRVVPMKKSIEIITEIKVEVKDSKRLVCVTEAVLRIYI